MARFTDEQLNCLKQDICLQRLAESQGIQLKKHGKDLIGLCPFHNDREPSLVITPDKNLWHCLGACQCGGSVIDWVMKAEGVSFKHAVELLQQDYSPSLVVKDTKPAKQSTVNKLDNPFHTDVEDQQLLNRVIDYYHDCLKQNPDALAYLEKRGINNVEAINTFKLGLSNRSLGYRLPKANRKEGAAIRGQLQKIGIYRESGHEHFNGSLVIPVIDEHGNVQEVYGRKLLDRLRKGTPKHCYLPGPHKGLFNQRAIQTSKEIILCESLIDALTFWCAGYKNVTCSYGIEGFTNEHHSAFKQYQTERVLIAYDRDKAGNEAASKLAKQLIENGIDCYRIHFPKGMDANDYAVQVQPANKSLGVVIRSAEWMGDGQGRSNVAGAGSAGATQGDKPLNKNDNDKTLINPSSLAAELQQVTASTRLPDAPKDNIEADIKDNEINLSFGGEPRRSDSGSHKAIPGQNRQYRVRGFEKNNSYEVMKVSLKVMQGEHWHLDTLDLCQLKARNSYIKQASIELGVTEDVIKSDLGKILLKLEALQDEKQQQTLTPALESATLTDKERSDALELLQSPDLLNRIINDFERSGIVGEKTNSLVGYLSAVSRKLDNPLAVIIQSTSAAGKSSLMEAVLRFIPNEDKHQYSAMTGQSLYYLGETNLKHKVLAIAEEEGAAQAAYALKLLQSEGQLTIASTTKDPESGDLATKEYKVEGPVMLFLTTTAIDIDDELLNRCLVLTVNEDREQTEAIHQLQRQRRTLEGLKQKTEKALILKQHQNAQRLLKPLSVVNPYAEQLTFLNNQTRTRRDHEKYLTLIDSIALLHQYQREIKTLQHGNQMIDYIEVVLNDIEIANQLAHEVLGRTLDELPPQTRKLLTLIDAMVTSHCEQQQIARKHYHFSRRAIRDYTGWSDGQLKIHCYRLQEMEYLLVHSGGRGKAIQYELLYDGKEDEQSHRLMGLIDTNTLKQQSATVPDVALPPPSMQSYDAEKIGVKSGKIAPSQGQDRPKSGGCQGSQNQRKANNNNASSQSDDELTENTYIKGNHTDASYVQTHSLVAVGK